jgi:hypothetical protein
MGKYDAMKKAVVDAPKPTPKVKKERAKLRYKLLDVGRRGTKR